LKTLSLVASLSPSLMAIAAMKRSLISSISPLELHEDGASYL
jgi:hypothetical protein